MLRAVLFSACFAISLSMHACELESSWEPWAPYQFINEQNELTGLDNELLTLVAEAAGCKVSIGQVPWKRALAMLKKGKLHVATGASFTKERDRDFLFSRAYRTEKVVLFAYKASLADFDYTSLETLANTKYRFGVVRGYYYGQAFNRLKKSGKLRGQISEAITDDQNFKKLTSSRLDGVLADQFVGGVLVAEMTMEGKIARMPTAIHESDIFFMFPKDGNGRATQQRFNQAIEKLNQDGKIQRIINRYLSE